MLTTNTPYNTASLRRQQPDYRGNVRLYNPRLLARDIAQGGAKNLRVIEADISYDGDHWVQNVGSVETSSQTDFDYGYFNLPASKMLERQGANEFEKGEFFFTRMRR